MKAKRYSVVYRWHVIVMSNTKEKGMEATTIGKKGTTSYKVVCEGCEVAIQDGPYIRYYKFSDPYTAAIFARMVGTRRQR